MLTGRTALVTGAASGIGYATAAAFAAAGARVLGLDYHEAALARAVGEIPGLQPIVCDLSNLEDEVDRLVDRHRVLAEVDVVANIAGRLDPAPLAAGLLREGDWTIRTMLQAPTHITQLLLPYMYARGDGVFINMSSVYGVLGGDGKGTYSIAKHGLLGLTRQTALEGARRGVRAFLVCPGHVETHLLADQAVTEGAFTGETPDQRLDTLRGQHPMGRFVGPDEVATVCLWLAADAPHAMTGCVIPVDCGWTAGTVSGLDASPFDPVTVPASAVAALEPAAFGVAVPPQRTAK